MKTNIYILALAFLLFGCFNAKEKKIKKIVSETLKTTLLHAEIDVSIKKNTNILLVVLTQDSLSQSKIVYPDLLRAYFNMISADLYKSGSLDEFSSFEVTTVSGKDSIFDQYNLKESSDNYQILYGNQKYKNANDYILSNYHDTLMLEFDHIIEKKIPTYFPQFDCKGYKFLDLVYIASREYENKSSYYKSKGCSCLYVLQYSLYIIGYKPHLIELQKVLKAMHMKVLDFQNTDSLKKDIGNHVYIE